MAVQNITTKMVAGVKYTVQTDSSADWSSVSNGTYFYDKATEIVYYKDATGTIIDAYAPETSTSQSQILYVDSANGVNEAGRGDLSKPFLTPEYALTQINNNGTFVGDTNTNTVISNISDADNANLNVGDYVYGSGISPFTKIISKGDEGGNANTITLDRATVATQLAITFNYVKIYTLKLNGEFTAVSNLYKDGVYLDFGNSVMQWGAFTLFSMAGTLVAPYSILGNGKFSGTTSTSNFVQNTTNQSAWFVIDINFDRIRSNTTGNLFNLNIGSSPLATINVKGNFVNAYLGTVGIFNAYAPHIDFDSYGLLGGITMGALGSSLFGCGGTLKGNHETPSAVTVGNVGQMINSTANLYGSTVWSYSTHRGRLKGTSHTFSSASLICALRSGGPVTVSAGACSITCVDDSTLTLTVNSNASCVVYGSGIDIATNNGTVENYADVTAQLAGTGNTYNYGKMHIGSSNSFNGTLENHGTLSSGSLGNTLDFTVKNYGIHSVSAYGIGRGGPWSYYNYGTLQGTAAFTNNSAMINLNNAGCLLDNYGRIINNDTDVTDAVIEKTAGTLYLRQGSYIKVSNGLSPIRCTANTSDSKDVYYFGVTSNCDGTTYGLTFAYDGAAFAPNDLAGGTLFENVNY